MENITLEKINFVNGSAGKTPLNSNNINAIQQNTENAINEVVPIITGIEENTENNNSDIAEAKINIENNTNNILEINKFIENSMKTMEAEGTSIHINDSADYPCSLRVEGKSEQKTRSGKNLLNLENLNSSTETWIVSAKKLTLTLKPNTQYTCSSNVPAPVDASIDAAIDKPLYFNGSSWNGGAGVCIGQSKTKTTDENGNLYIAVALNRTYSEELLNGTYYIQIEEGTTATDFEEYGVMPSPDYPSQIENVSGDLEIKVAGKNLFNKSDLKAATYLDVNGAEQSSAYWDTSNYMDVEAGNKLTYQGISQVGGFGYNAFYDKDKNFISSFKSVVGGETKDIPENAKYVRFCFVRAVGDVQTFQLELGETATAYEAYKEQTVTFPFSEGQKLMQGGYLGENGVVNKRKQLTLTGNENWQRQSTTHTNVLNLYLTLESKGANRDNVLCSVAKQSDSCGANNDSIVDICSLNTTLANFLIDLDLSEFADITAWKTYLAEQYSAGTPVVIEYELEEEETTAYTSTQQTAYNTLQKFKTYRTTTNISNNQNTNMVLTYKKDLQTQFQEIETMLLESGM